MISCADLSVAPAKVGSTIEQVTTTLSGALDDVFHATTTTVKCESEALVRLRALMRIRVPAIASLAPRASPLS